MILPVPRAIQPPPAPGPADGAFFTSLEDERVRGVELHFFFTGGPPALDLASHARVRFMADCTHTVTDLEHQATFIQDMRDWAQQFDATVRESLTA